MSAHSFLAFDLGAESGRAMRGVLEDGRVHVHELRRFANGMLTLRGHYHWNIFRLFEEMRESLKAYAPEFHSPPESIGIDTWGVDFGLLAEDGSILGLPYAYRDPRTEGVMDEVFALVPRTRVYELTGIQFLPFNTLFQLYAMHRARSPILEAATDLLFIPDLFNYLLTGEKKTERTFATTSQLYNPNKRDWDDELFAVLGIRRSLMQDIVQPGSLIGRLDDTIAFESGMETVPVIAVASHDTASAVAAVPAEGDDWAYISSGTWSLMGIETKRPVITKQALEANFTNEGGVENTFRFLKNISGLWLLQECRRKWSQDRPYSYDELMKAAESAPPFASLVDVDDPGFLNPSDMPEAIRLFCRRKGETQPGNQAEFVRCIVESLALKYRSVLDQLRRISSYSVNRIHVIGGGARNQMLCQFTANATGVPVIAGPAEATAIGNIMIQALSLGYVSSLSEIRGVVRKSCELVVYEPKDVERWDAAYRKFLNVVQQPDVHR